MLRDQADSDPLLHLVRDAQQAPDILPRTRRDVPARGGDGECIAVDPRTRALLSSVDRVAESDCAVLVTGETGTGKEVIARKLFQRSGRRRAKFVPVNCGALPDTLAESELFGHRRGAFTGAVADKTGLVEEADGGVLFLDEIGDMPPPIQVRMLRFLDSGEMRRVGDTAVRHVDVRVIAATNRSLEQDVRSGSFREDLFYRLNVIALHVPPLRERPGDIPALASHYLARSAARLRKAARTFSTDAHAVLLQYPWPGNVRQLQNVVECAAIAAAGEIVTPGDLPPAVRLAGPATDRAGEAPLDGELEQVALALVRYSGNQQHAATSLGISRTTLWRRLKRLNAEMVS